MQHLDGYLIQSVVFLASAVLAVVLSHRFGLGSVAGYLVAGVLIGPFGLKLVGSIDDVRHFAELGVVFLLFVIGLELEPKRLWKMRVRMLSLGVSQVVGSIAVIAAIGWLAGVDARVAILAGMALALSSTALALQPLTERGALRSNGGQAVFAILLFQDIAVIPMLALLPLLAASGGVSFSWGGLGFAAAVIAATLIGGHYAARPVFRHIARTGEREIFTAFALLLVLGIAWAYEAAGLSMALGSFLAGVLLAESEYRHEIEAAVEPFKGLLLGLFFMAVGMGVDFGLLLERPALILGIIVGLFALKSAVLWVIARAARIAPGERPLFVLLLAQGGEFAFVLLTLGVTKGVLPTETAQAMTLAVALSMLSTPFLLVLHDRVLAPRFAGEAPAQRPGEPEPEPSRVIVAGLGRVGQVVARLLHGSGYEPTILDDDPDHVELSRRFGFRVFYGDATRLDLLEAAGAATADFLIIALDDPDATTLLARTVQRRFPKLRIVARAHDMRHLFELRDAGVEIIERETFRSALALGEATLAAVGADPARAARAVQIFAEHDGEVLAKLYAVHRGDADAFVTASNELRDQFQRTLQEDEERIAAEADDASRKPA